MPQLAGRSKLKRAAVDAAIENDRGIAEGAEGDRHRATADDIVHDFMVHHDAQRIGARIPVLYKTDDGVPQRKRNIAGVTPARKLPAADKRAAFLEFDVGNRNKSRIIDRRD